MRQRIPILTYHSLDESGSVISVPPRSFREHMQTLARRGFRAISLRQLLDAWAGHATLPGRPVVLTFDDAFANLLEHAAPLLSDLGFGATVFAVAGFLGRANDWPHQTAAVPRLPLLSGSDLARLATMGFEVGAHGMTHSPLAGASRALLQREVVEGRRRLEDTVGLPVISFAYPFGLVDPQGRDLVAAHYGGACTTVMSVARETDDRHCLPRLDVYYLRGPALFRLFGTVAGDAYLRIRAFGRTARSGLVRSGFRSN